MGDRSSRLGTRDLGNPQSKIESHLADNPPFSIFNRISGTTCVSPFQPRRLGFDPFVGVGSSIIAAILHDRKGMGVDKERLYTDIAFERTILALNRTFRKRPLGKPIWKPKGNEKTMRPSIFVYLAILLRFEGIQPICKLESTLIETLNSRKVIL